MASKSLPGGVISANTIGNSMYGRGSTAYAPREQEAPPQAEEQTAQQKPRFDIVEFADSARREKKARQAAREELIGLLWESNERVRHEATLAQDREAELVTVTQVVGKSVPDASVALRRAGLALGRLRHEYNDQVPAGQVIAQFPAPGASLPKGGGVIVLVSKGGSCSNAALHRQRQEFAACQPAAPQPSTSAQIYAFPGSLRNTL